MWKIISIMFICLASKVSVGQKIPGEQDSKKQVDATTLSASIKSKNITGVRFDISASRLDVFKETIKIKATLFNNNVDTIYFLTSTCDGEQYSLRYDTAKFISSPFINCNASYPRIQKIAPKGQYDFLAHFHSIRKETKINLGFDFYIVDKSIDLSKISLDKIHNRPTKEQNILWTGEKTIK
jgi:hypothetical protein